MGEAPDGHRVLNHVDQEAKQHQTKEYQRSTTILEEQAEMLYRCSIILLIYGELI
ncbi:MAG: hypothetical protein RQ885_01770 [Desulfurococcales archaeon]|nr:hypothetical protein [Desulfurococcales archaeon]